MRKQFGTYEKLRVVRKKRKISRRSKKLKFKKIVLLTIVAVIVASVAASTAACKNEEQGSTADLIAVRINNFMAEWENIDYNFTYEGSSALKVSVPYTNYLQVNDILVSPEAEYKVYEDEARTKEIKDLEKIYVDEEKTLYIDVVNGEKANSYSVTVTVKQTNLPPRAEREDKQYDNRGGHVYIYGNSRIVNVDGIVYDVVYGEITHELLKSGRNIIATQDGELPWNYLEDIGSYKGHFNGNNYTFYDNPHNYFVKELEENAVIQNMVIKQLPKHENVARVNFLSSAGSVCTVNNGTIRNVYADVSYIVDPAVFQSLGFFANENYGTIENCITVGDLESMVNCSGAMMGAMVTEQSGTMINCVNTGNVIWNRDDVDDVSGAGAVCYAVDTEKAVFKGVYNLGKCEMPNISAKKIDKKLKGLCYTTKGGKKADLSGIKTYV